MKKQMLLTSCILIALLPASGRTQHKLESWYLYFGLGYADPQYSDDLDAALNSIADQPGVSHASLGFDLLGLYWPTSDRTIIGGVINAAGDRYEQGNTSLQLSTITLGFSLMHYLTDERGKGFFLRGDAGPARFGIDLSGGGVSVTETSEWGFGGLVGAGYAIPVSDGTRILLNANYALRKVEGESVGVLAITVGGLF